MALEPGDTFCGRYEILSVHPGGMGVVYVVRDPETGERYAAKVLKEELRDDVRARRRFDREVRTWVDLERDANVVTALFIDEHAGAPVLFLEYVDGPTLAEVIDRDAPLLLAAAVDLACQFARGLAHAHEARPDPHAAGLVHRDVKPENLFVTKERVGKVSDLGIVKILSADLAATAEGIGMGTPFYVSPEQLKGALDVDGRSDVYSFGAVLYEMVTGRIPLKGDSLESQIYMILREDPEPPSRINPVVPAALEEIVLRCLSKKAADRYSGFRPLERDLREWLEASSDVDPPASSCPSCGWASPRRPASCPVCGAAMGAAAAFSPVVLGAATEAPLPARLEVVDLRVHPHVAPVGETIRVTVSVANHGTTTARRAEMTLAVPDPDTFRLEAPEEKWRGEIPPTPSGRPFSVEYEMVPLREGAYSFPPPEILWRGDDDEPITATGRIGAKLAVTINYQLPLAGFRREWSRMTACLEPGTPVFVLVESDPGGGRSRFLSEARSWVEDRGRRVFRGKALEQSREPNKPFHDVARAIFGIGMEPLPPSSLMARVIDRLAPHVGEDPAMAGFFAGFLRGAELPPAQLVMRDYFWFRLLSALCREGPVTVMLDDLQWSTRETLDLAEDLARRAREDGVPLSVVVSSLTTGTDATTRRRIARLRERFAALGTNPDLTERIRLPALDEAAVGELLDHLFPGNTLAEDHPWLVPTLAERSGGNPYHLMQILRLLREARDDFGEPLVSAEGGAWTFRGGLNQGWFHEVIPPGVEDLVRAVVAPLPEPGIRVLEAAAAIGREFEVGLLAELIADPAAVDEGLEALEQADLIRPRDEAGERYRFTNSLVPSVVERMVRERSLRSLTRLHREIARALERYHGSRGLRSAARRYARHLRLAGERDEALKWFVTAAEESVRQQLYLRAEMALARAGELLLSGVPATEDVLGRYWSLKGEVSRVTGNPSEALAALQEAIEHLSDEESRATLAATMSRMGRIHEVRGELDRALYSYQVGAQIREDLDDRVEMASSLNELGSVELLQGEEARAEETFRRARRLAEESENPAALGDALDNLANLHVRRGEWEEAEDLYRQSLELGERGHDRLGVAKSLNGIGNLALRRGDLRGARDSYERAIAIRREVGDREGVANLLSNLGVVHDRMGDFEAALRYYRRSADAHREMGSRMGLGTVLNNIGVVSLDRGDVGMAIERFEEALAIRREIGDRNRLGNALVNLAEALALAGRMEESLELLDEAETVFTGAADPVGAAGVHVARSGVLRATGDLAGAERAIDAALRHEGREPRTRALLHLEAAEIHFARGENEAAERAAVRGRSHAVESGDRLAMAHGLRLEGRAEQLRGDRESAERHLDAAEVLLRGTSGPELARVYLERARLRGDTDTPRAREILMQTRGLLDALEARGAVLPEKVEVDERLGS